MKIPLFVLSKHPKLLMGWLMADRRHQSWARMVSRCWMLLSRRRWGDQLVFRIPGWTLQSKGEWTCIWGWDAILRTQKHPRGIQLPSPFYWRVQPGMLRAYEKKKCKWNFQRSPVGPFSWLVGSPRSPRRGKRPWRWMLPPPTLLVVEQGIWGQIRLEMAH